jgi:diacylglycerol kinase (ATP)
MIVIFNPIAGRRRHERLRAVLAELNSRGVQPELRETRARGDAVRIARDVAQEGAAVVVAAGGDGTIAEVAEGLRGSRTQLGILPLGTANVLALELRLPRTPAGLAETLTSGTPRWLRPGLITFADGSDRLFVQMLGIGFDAAVVGAIDLSFKRRLGRAAYVLQAARELVRYRFPRCVVELDGARLEAASVIVTKGRLYAGNHVLAPGARPDMAGFHVAVFRHGGPGSAALAGLALPLNMLPQLPGVSLHVASEIRLLASTVPRQMDGDPAGYGTAEIAEAPQLLPVLVPATV